MPTSGRPELKAYQEKVAAEFEAKKAQDAANAEKEAAKNAEIEKQKAADEAARIAAEADKNKGSEEQKKIEAEKIEAARIAKEAEDKAKLDAEKGATEIDYDNVDIDKLIEKKTGAKFKKWQEVEERLNKEPEKLKYANSFIEKYNEAIEKGISHETFIKTQNTDYSKLSDIDKIKHGFALENPTLSEKEIALLVEDAYPVGVPEDADDDEKKKAEIAQIKLKRDALSYENKLKEMQVKVLDVQEDPEKAKLAQEAALKAEAKEKERIETQQKYNKDVTEALSKFKELKIKIGEEEQDVFTYQLEAKELEKVAEMAKNPDKIWALWRNQDGTLNMSKMIEDLALLTSAGDLNQKKAAAMEARSLEAYMKGKKNIDFSKGDKNQRQGLDNDASIKELAKQFA